MPLHKSSRASRLDPTMISAPLGDFRHTMHIGRGGDAFGDTSFLSTHGPSSPSTNSVPGTLSTVDSDIPLNSDASDNNSLQTCELRHSESVSSLTLDLDLGPSILGDVLGIMDGLVLDSEWTTSKVGVFSPGQSVAELELGGCGENLFVNVKNDMEVYGEALRDEQMTEESGPKLKGAGPRPKVRFSDKRDEIIGRDEECEGLEQDPAGFVSPSEVQCEKGNGMSSYCHERLVREAEPANHSANSPPSPASSLGSEYEGVPPLDRRRGNDHLSESESESEEEGVGCERGYTFEDEFDDEIGL